MSETQEQTRAKHTPGPWEITNLGDGRIFIVAHEPDGCMCQPAAVLGDATDSVYGPMVLANASLIAAAPTMFDALDSAPVIRLGETFDEFAVRFKQWHREVRVPAVQLAKAESAK